MEMFVLSRYLDRQVEEYVHDARARILRYIGVVFNLLVITKETCKC